MFKVGDKVRITGDYDDCTDHLDGMIGEVVEVFENDCYVKVGPGSWFIFNNHMTLVQ